MKLSEIHSVYFVGIGGIGMSAIARWFHQRGVLVGGYDRVETTLTSQLSREGIWIHYEDHLEGIPGAFMKAESSLIIYTPAVPETHSELSFFQSGAFHVMKRSEILGLISKNHYTVAVAGTHGKTTTSSMVAHLLHHSEQGCSAFIGGIMTNYETNLLVGNDAAPVVVEADEFDRSFHRLLPNHSIVTSVDPDHLDIYGNEEEMKKAFVHFIDLSGEQGETLLNYQVLDEVKSLLHHPFRTYGMNEGDIQARNLRADNGCSVFDYHGEVVIENLKLMVPGFHNVENAVAAITVALDLGMDVETIADAIGSYRGVKRRFEYIIKSSELIMIDDYAHHPTEISAFLRSVKSLFPDKKVTAIFQPHLYSRTNDFQQGFAESLSLADEVVLLDIYPAREEPMEGVSSEIIFDKMTLKHKVMCLKNDLMAVMKSRNVELVCTIGAGDIDKEVSKLKEFYLNQYEIEA